jgi:hypothetical protein
MPTLLSQPATCAFSTSLAGYRTAQRKAYKRLLYVFNPLRREPALSTPSLSSNRAGRNVGLVQSYTDRKAILEEWVQTQGL